MSQKYIHLAMLLALLVALRAFVLARNLPQLPFQIQVARSLDSESQLALGQKLPFETVNQYDLELIPRISYVLAERLLKQRSQIISRAKELPPEQRHQAFELVKGIGTQTSKKLNAYLTFSQTAVTPAKTSPSKTN